MRRVRFIAVLVGAIALLATACGDDEPAAQDGSAVDDAADLPTVVVTTSILGDVVESVAGDQVEVVTIMPVGADPHDFQASAQQANEMREADALVVNGASFEEGILDVIETAEADGTPTYEAISPVETIEFGEGGHSHSDEEKADGEAHSEEDGHSHSDEEKAEDEAHSDEEGHSHDHDGADPHFWTDPARMTATVDGLVVFLEENVDGIDAEALEASAADYVAELEALDAEVEEVLAGIPEDRQVLVTNHDSFGYFADRYGFEVIGTVIPSGSTADGASAGDLAELAEVIEAEGVPAIFADNTAPEQLAETLATEVGDVEVVQLYTGSLGDADSEGATYVAMIGTNAERIAAALG